MKKLYFSAVLAVAALIPSAAGAQVIRLTGTPAAGAKTLVTDAGQFNAVDIVGKYGMPGKAAKGDMKNMLKRSNGLNENINNFNWAAMDGKATFHEDFGNVIFSLGVQEYQTPILTATNAAETYALGPFNSSYPYYQDIKSAGCINANNAGYLWCRADEHDYVTFPIFDTGWIFDWGNGLREDIYVASLAWVMEYMNYDKSLVKNAGLGGINESGHIYWPCTGSVVFTTSSLLDTDNPWYSIDDDGLFGFCIPGVTVSEGDDEIELSIESYCFDNNEVKVHMKAGRNIKVFKYGFYQAFSEDMFDDVIANGGGGEYVAEGDINISLGGDAKGNQRIYFAVVAGNSSGMIKDAAYVEIHLVPNDDEDWSEPKIAQFSEGILADGIYDIPTHTYNIAYQEHKDKPGYIRLVEPFGKQSEWIGSEINMHPDHSHNHFIFIDATDPTAVVLESSPLGLIIDSDAGHAIVTSEAHERIKFEGRDKAQMKNWGCTGTLANNNITFPAGKIWYAENKYNGGQYYSTNKTGKLAVQLTDQPAVVGVEGVEAAPAQSDAVYFNLRGQRMQQPAKGTVTIVSRDGKASIKAF